VAPAAAAGGAGTEAVPVPTILLTGTIGSGKTAVASEIGLLLQELALPVAIIDLDWLGWVHVGPGLESVDGLIARNLAAIWPNLRAAGVRYLVLARAMKDGQGLAALRQALPAANITTVRLTSSARAIGDRLRRRDTGAIREGHLEESAAMAKDMDRAAVETFQVSNEDRPVRSVAVEVLVRAGWIGSTQPGAIDSR
jgi:adenylylsulfate kinase